MSGVEAAAASYQTLRGHLAYLKLTRAEEVLAAHLEAARAQQLSHVAFLEGLLAEEVAATRDRRHRARLRFAHFPVTKHLADFDFDFQPSVDRRLVEELATLAFLDAGTHALFMGPPGVGKTHLAIGLGHEVVAAGYRSTPAPPPRPAGRRMPSIPNRRRAFRLPGSVITSWRALNVNQPLASQGYVQKCATNAERSWMQVTSRASRSSGL
jgi:IstB-like ATP binding protein